MSTSSPDPHARELAHELVGAVIAMYGDGLRRIIEAIGHSREAGATILDQLVCRTERWRAYC